VVTLLTDFIDPLARSFYSKALCEGAMSQARQYLDEADRLLAESKARVEQQKQRVANLEAATARSKALLRELEDTLLLITTQRQALFQELGQDLTTERDALIRGLAKDAAPSESPALRIDRPNHLK
jgi:sugar-specific transcriptional regulator TrmB